MQDSHLWSTTEGIIAAAVAALGDQPLTEAAIATHLRPLFQQTLASPRIYLASHSLGRPLDAMQDDLREGAAHWQNAWIEAWKPWLEEEVGYRGALAELIGSPRLDCIVPRVSASDAMRLVLNMLPYGARVLSTDGEIDSVATLLDQYAAAGRILVERIGVEGIAAERITPDQSGSFHTSALADAVRAAAAEGSAFALVVVSQVFYATGQLLRDLDELSAVCHHFGTRLLVDSYHAVGIVPIDVRALDCDFLIGGCYKYLRGGPGATFLYLSPQALSAAAPAPPLKPDPTPILAPSRRPGGDAYLEGTPPALTYYQARSGLAFTRAVGVERLRAYSQQQLQTLRSLLAERDIESFGGDDASGAFLTLPARNPESLVAALAGQGIVANTQRGRLRLGPDCLISSTELELTVRALANCRAWLG